MSRVAFASGAIVSYLALTSNSAALPDLWKSTGFPEFTNVVVYKDHADPNLYWILPNRIVFEKDSDGNTRFSMSHQGVTKSDVDGIGGRVNFTAMAVFENEEFMEKTWKPFVQSNPDAKLAIVPGDRSYVEFLMEPELVADSSAPPPRPSQPAAETTVTVNVPTDTVVVTEGAADPAVKLTFETSANALEGARAGLPNQPFAFQTSLNRLGSRVLAYTDEDYKEINRPLAMIVRYQYVFKGLGPRYKIKISVNWNRVQTYFQSNTSKSKWFGLKKSQDVVITKDLKDNAAITYEILEGALSPDQADQAAANELFKLLTNARVNGTGLFKPAFEPTVAAGGGGGSSGFLGWGSSSRSFSETLSQNVTSTFVIEKKETEERLLKIGYSIGEFCEASPELFLNLTENNHPCISPQDMEKLKKISDECFVAQQPLIERARNRYLDGSINKQTYTEIKDTVINECLATRNY